MQRPKGCHYLPALISPFLHPAILVYFPLSLCFGMEGDRIVPKPPNRPISICMVRVTSTSHSTGTVHPPTIHLGVSPVFSRRTASLLLVSGPIRPAISASCTVPAQTCQADSWLHILVAHLRPVPASEYAQNQDTMAIDISSLLISDDIHQLSFLKTCFPVT